MSENVLPAPPASLPTRPAEGGIVPSAEGGTVPSTESGTVPSTAPRLVRSAVVVLAAGSGSRVGATIDGEPVNKVLVPLAGLAVLAHSVQTALSVPGLQHLVVVARPGEEQEVAAVLTPILGESEVRLVSGGATRHASEWAGIRAVASEVETGEVEVVAVHDGARPLASAALYTAVVATAAEHGGAVPVSPARSLVTLDGSPRPEAAVGVQTPQAFRAIELVQAYRAAQADGFEGTDTASCLAAYAPEVRIAAVGSGATNLKVTFPEDVTLAESLLARR